MKRSLFTLLCVVAVAGPACGQGVAVTFQPDRAVSGPGGKFSVAVTLENPYARAIAAYQLFLGFDADLLAAEEVTWPEGAVLGDGRFATGPYDGRVAKLFPEWRDGLGMDVVSVSGFRALDDDPGREGVLCLITFRVRASTRTTTSFSLDPGPYATFSGVFDNEGLSVPLTFSVQQVSLSTVGPLANVRCTRTDADVTVTWDGPASAVDKIEVRRDGVLLTKLNGDAVSYVDRAVVPGAHAYDVAAVRGAVTGPRESCVARVFLDGPRDLRCVFDGQAVQLTWTLPFTYGYMDLTRNGDFLVRLDGGATSYQDAVSAQDATTLHYELQGLLAGFPSETATCDVNLSTQQGRFLRGDTNMDKKRQLSDAVLLLRYLFSGGTLRCLDSADVDDNGKVNIGDAVALLGYLFSGGASPAPPTQEPGTDPTEDGLSCAEGLTE